MALIKCRECGKEFSDKASACIHCGCPTEEEKENTKNSNQQNLSQKKKKDNSNTKVMDIIRYCVGVFCLLFIMSIKGLGIIFILLAVALILPITSKLVYEKISVPKAIKILLPIILMVVAFCIGSTNQTLTCTFVADYDDYNMDVKRVFYYKNQVLSTFDHNSYMKFNDTSTGETMFKFFDKNTDNFNKYEGVEYKVTFNAKNELRMLSNIDVISAPEMFVSFISNSNINEKSSINEIKSALEKEKYTCKIK